MVRLVDWERTAESHHIDTYTLPGNTVNCDLATFNNFDPMPGKTKMCECTRSIGGLAGGDGFHLNKRLTSKTLLQESWIMLLRLLGRTQLLPMGTGDRTYKGMENWAARHSPNHMPMVLERVWIEQFVDKIAPVISGPRCLEWGDPAKIYTGDGFNYANIPAGCTAKVTMQFDAVFWGQRQMGMDGPNVVYSDIDHLPAVLTQNGDYRVNTIFATQVFEHLHNPEQAVYRLAEALLPGGILVITAPQQAQFHLVPHDFFRYTKEGLQQLLANAGLCAPKWGFAGGGDFVFDIARDAGLQVQDFPMEEILGAFQFGFDAVSDSAIVLGAVAFKPPHEACGAAAGPVMGR